MHMESRLVPHEAEVADAGIIAPDQNEQESSHEDYSEYASPDLGPDAFRSLYRNMGSDRFWMSDESAESSMRLMHMQNLSPREGFSRIAFESAKKRQQSRDCWRFFAFL